MHRGELGRRTAAPGRIAAVIATFNRAGLLRNTLESLAAQRLSSQEFEVVVVDDGSTDETRDVVAECAGSMRLHYTYQQNAGLASARNHGLFLTRAPLLLFLDDDDIAGPGLLAQHIRTHERYPGDNYAVLGYTALDAEIASDPLMQFITEVGCFLFSYPHIRNGQVLDWSYFWGGRSSCKRAFLMEHGIFNPVFRFGCEDVELGFRLSWHGLRVVYNASAVSTMTRKVSFDGFCDRLTRQGRSNYVFSCLHGAPEVQAWSEVPDAERRWSEIEPAYDAILRSARAMDRAAALKVDLGLELEESERQLLHRGYWTAFRAAKLKGIREGSQVPSAARRTA